MWIEKGKKDHIEQTEKLDFEKIVLSEVWKELKEKVRIPELRRNLKIKTEKDKNLTKVRWENKCKKKKGG